VAAGVNIIRGFQCRSRAVGKGQTEAPWHVMVLAKEAFGIGELRREGLGKELDTEGQAITTLSPAL